MNAKITWGRLGQIGTVLVIILSALLTGAFVVVKRAANELEDGSKWVNEQALKGLESSNQMVEQGNKEVVLEQIRLGKA